MLLMRTWANLVAGRYEAARHDSLTVFRRFSPFDEKARRDLILSLYSLGQYQESKDYMISLGYTPDEEELQRVNKRLDEQRGIWDFREIQALAKDIHKPQMRHSIDVASYVSLTEVKDAGVAGRGLFAKIHIKSGELILCEKAYSFSVSTDDNKKIFCIADIPKQRIKLASGESLLVETIQKLCRNPSSASKLLDLYSGDYNKVSGLGTIVDENVVIDT